MNLRYLTKSRFKLAVECPAKLYYTGKQEYPDQKLEDSFLLDLAEGGFQVAELARCYFPGGHHIKTLNYQEALSETRKLLEQDQVTIFEAAIAAGSLFIRADILVKEGNRLELFEVKAKSVDLSQGNPFVNTNGGFYSSWTPYLIDVAFQKYVIQEAFPQLECRACLMMADKTAICPTDGFNQKFRLVKDERGRKTVVLSDKLTDADLTPPILAAIPVDEECEQLFEELGRDWEPPMDFNQLVHFYARHYEEDKKIPAPLSPVCVSCEFNTTEEEERAGLKSGKKECWKEQLGWGEEDFQDLTVLDVWNFPKKSALLESGCIKMNDLQIEDVNPSPDGKPGISASERRWLQIEKYQSGDDTPWIDGDNLKREMDSWVYPLHFIDFETTMVAIPFHRGQHPYEGIAFQFSHHLVHKDGRVEHAGQYLNTKPGVFPNVEFVRELKAQLEGDEGSIFRYSNHENTYLNLIYQQILQDDQVEDREALLEFIRSITKSTKNGEDQWMGERAMVDLWELVKRYYYDPATQGSNSIKVVLPAILNRSEFLQKKYGQPIYGSPGGIPSLNYQNWQWIQFEKGKVIDPYKLLPKMFQDIPEREMELLLSEDDSLREGGAAMTAYARMQFEEMSDYEREEITKALLKYCELDTLAMVMIVEGWREMIR